MKKVKIINATLINIPEFGLEREILNVISKKLAEGDYEESREVFTVNVEYDITVDWSNLSNVVHKLSTIHLEGNGEEDNTFLSFSVFTGISHQDGIITVDMNKTALTIMTKMVSFVPKSKQFELFQINPSLKFYDLDLSEKHSYPDAARYFRQRFQSKNK